MTAKSDKSGNSGELPLVFACSGGSDVGNLTDLGARELTRRRLGRMYCLAGIGGRVETILKTTRAATRVLAIDGCPENCARKTLEQAGFSNFLHLQLHDIGMVKGQSVPTIGRVQRVTHKAVELLG